MTGYLSSASYMWLPLSLGGKSPVPASSLECLSLSKSPTYTPLPCCRPFSSLLAGDAFTQCVRPYPSIYSQIKHCLPWEDIMWPSHGGPRNHAPTQKRSPVKMEKGIWMWSQTHELQVDQRWSRQDIMKLNTMHVKDLVVQWDWVVPVEF